MEVRVGAQEESKSSPKFTYLWSCRDKHTPTVAEARTSKMVITSILVSPLHLAHLLLRSLVLVCDLLGSIAVAPICWKNFLQLTFFFFFFFFFLCIRFSWLSQLESTSDLYDKWSYKRRHYCDYTKQWQNERSDGVYILSALGNN